MFSSYTFAADYFILVFVAGVGAIQVAASVGGLRGLLVFKTPLVARAVGLLVAVAAFVWFFTTTEWNINDYEGGLDSNDQALLFFMAIMAAGAFTLGLSSVVNFRMRDDGADPAAGFDALRRACYVRALGRSLRRRGNGEGGVGGRG